MIEYGVIVKKLSLNNKILYSFFIIAMLLAWVGGIDKMAYELNIQSLKETLVAFLALKEVDALMTVAKSFPYIGHMLLPYKNFFDHMSYIMLISFLSLGLQKVILVVMQSFIVNFILSINVIVVVANGVNKFLSYETSRKAFKLLIIILFIRFAIPLQTFAAMSIQSEIAHMSTQAHHEKINKLEEKIVNVKGLIKENKDEKDKNKMEIISLDTKKGNLEKTNKSLESNIKSIRSKNRNSLEKAASFVYNTDTDEMKKAIVPIQNKIDENNTEIKLIESKIDTLDGGSLLSVISIESKIKTALVNISAIFENMFDLFLTSAIMFFFINVLFPILFLWSLSKLIDKAFNTTYSDKLNASIKEKI